jgi:predicted nucleic acid-binding protein
MKYMKDAKCFLDSNIWIYALGEQEPQHNFEVALSLLKEHNVYLSIQVVNEVVFNLMVKCGFTEERVTKVVNYFFGDYRDNLIEIESDVILTGIRVSKRYQLRYWDSLIISAALKSGADILYSEDMHDGLIVKMDERKIKIINPFDK